MSSICIVVNSLGSGGAERIATNIAIYYHERGHKVTVLAFRKEGQYLSEIPRDINIIGLKSKAGKRLVFEIVPVLRRVDADIIISANRNTNIIVGVTSFFYRARIIFREANTLNEIDFFSFYGRLKLILLMRFSYLFADRVIANSEDTKNDLLKYEIVSRDKVKVVGNPVLYVGAKEKSKEKLTHKWLGNKEYKTILNVGRLHKQKNQRLLLEAFSEVVGSVNNARLIILGEGEEKEGLIKLSKKLKVNDHVDFVGFQKTLFPITRAQICLF